MREHRGRPLRSRGVRVHPCRCRDGASTYGNRPLRTVEAAAAPREVAPVALRQRCKRLSRSRILPRFDVGDFWDALLAALLIGALNATLAPLVAAVRLPYTVATSFLLLLLLNAVVLRVVDALTEGAVEVGGFGSGIVAALVITAIATALEVVAGTNDDDAYMIRVIQRIARRSGERIETDVPGIVFLEIDGLAKPVLQRAMRDGNASTMARWLADGSHRFLEWETDLSSQTGASQAGILLGSNDDIPAFRWVEKERGIVMACSAPADCAEIERRLAGDGLLRNGGASRGNLLSGRPTT